MSQQIEIRRLSAADAVEHLDGLAAVLVDCVEGGASVSYMAPFSLSQARSVFEAAAADVDRGGRLLLAAFAAGELVGTVQVLLDLPPNQPHRGEIEKLLVRRSARRRGVARLLMEHAELHATAEGRTLLVLDTASDAAERVYERLGWIRVGVVPGFALYPDGRPCDTTFFWKALPARAHGGSSERQERAAHDAITLEPLSDEHRAELTELVADPCVQRFTRVASAPLPGHAEELLARYEAGRRDGTREGFAILEDGRFVGVAVVPRIDRQGGSAELGYVVVADVRGRGVATRALELLTAWAFSELAALRLELLIDVENERSKRVAQRCGYVREGVLRSLWVKPGVRRDTELWSRLAGSS